MHLIKTIHHYVSKSSFILCRLFLAFPVVYYTCLKDDIKSISAKDMRDGDFTQPGKYVSQYTWHWLPCPLKSLHVSLISLSINLSFLEAKTKVVWVSANMKIKVDIEQVSKTRLCTYVHRFTSNSKVRCKLRQVIFQSLTYAPSKSNYNSITPCVFHIIVVMPKVINQFGLICNTIHSWKLNALLGCPWLKQLGGGTVIGIQRCAKSKWHTQVIFSWYGCNQIIKLRIIDAHLYFLLAQTLYQLYTFGVLVNNGRALALGSAVLWDDVTGKTDSSQLFAVCKNA